MNDTNNLPEAVEVALAELLHAQLLLGVATAKRRPTADAPEVLAASKALIAVCDAVRAALAQPAAPDRWNEGFKYGQWLAKHSTPVVERADSATPVVERSAGNVSDNAATVAPAEPASEPAERAVWLPPGRCPTPRACEHNGKCHGKCAAPQPAPAPRLRWVEAPRRTEWGAGMMEALIALGVDETLRLYAHRDAVPMVDALLSAQPAPARVPLTEAEIASMQRKANTTGVQFLQSSTVRWIVRATEAAHGITPAKEAP